MANYFAGRFLDYFRTSYFRFVVVGKHYIRRDRAKQSCNMQEGLFVPTKLPLDSDFTIGTYRYQDVDWAPERFNIRELLSR